MGERPISSRATDFDVLIVGAGLSGIGMAAHMKEKTPEHSFAIVERRDDLGGTWDLFRYPGVRSDSDMYTLGFEFRPWLDVKVLADGPSIQQYIADTAAEFGIDDKIHYGLTVLAAEWSSVESRWTVTAQMRTMRHAKPLMKKNGHIGRGSQKH